MTEANFSPVSFRSNEQSSIQSLLTDFNADRDTYFFSNHEGAYSGAVNFNIRYVQNSSARDIRNHLRWQLPEIGRTVIPTRLRNIIFEQESAKQGFEVSQPRLIDITDSTDDILKQIRRQGIEQLSLFAPNLAFSQANQRSSPDLRIAGLDPDYLKAVDLYGDKVNLLNCLQRADLLPTFPYLLLDKNGKTQNNQVSLSDLIDFSTAKSGGEHSFFVQRANSSGGRGNFIVKYSKQKNSYIWPDRICTDLNATLTKVKELAVLNNDRVRVSPFLDLRDTFSIGVCVKSKDKQIFLGPREQLIDDKKSFIGFSYRHKHEPQALQMAHQLVDKLLIDLPDFVGSFGIDFGRFYNPCANREELFIAEVNMRLDGTMPLSRIILRYNSQQWLKGELHIAQLDYVSTSILCHKQLLAKLRSALPIYRPDDPYGLIALTPAIQNSGKQQADAIVSLGAVSNCEYESRELLRAAAIELLK